MRCYWIGVLGLLFLAAPAHADKLIWIPTADVKGVQGEFMSGDGDGGDVITAQLGLGQAFEILGRRYRSNGRERNEIGGQLQILPEGFATPGLAIGLWDAADDTSRGRRAFAVLSKKIPGVNFLPTLLRELRVHGGVGTGELSGPFLGALAGLPLGLTLALEASREGFNAGLWWSPLKVVRLKAESWDGDLFFGAQVRAPL
jgi:hypothetical protein